MIFGIDIHPEFQAGLNITALPAEGIGFVSIKVSEGTTDYWVRVGSAEWARQAKDAGLIAMGYHYLRPGNIGAQARVFTGALRACGGIPGVLDAEAIDSAGNATLTIGDVRDFCAACKSLGVTISLLYLPRWYHEKMGHPSLAGLPALWASGYPGGTGTPAKIYQGVTPKYWTAYGNNVTAVLQFTDAASAGGRTNVDANAFFGNTKALAAFLGLSGHRARKESISMDVLPATDMPGDANSDPASWPERNYTVGWNVSGGWEGSAAFSVGAQDWSGRTKDLVRGFIYLASWVFPDGRLIPVDPAYTKEGKGRYLELFKPTNELACPTGCVGVTLNYSLPGGGYVATGRSG